MHQHQFCQYQHAVHHITKAGLRSEEGSNLSRRRAERRASTQGNGQLLQQVSRRVDEAHARLQLGTDSSPQLIPLAALLLGHGQGPPQLLDACLLPQLQCVMHALLCMRQRVRAGWQRTCMLSSGVSDPTITSTGMWALSGVHT